MTRHGRKPDETTLSVWQVIELARHPERPYSLDYIRRLAPDFIELHGDRLSADDPALVGGVGTELCKAATLLALRVIDSETTEALIACGARERGL